MTSHVVIATTRYTGTILILQILKTAWLLHYHTATTMPLAMVQAHLDWMADCSSRGRLSLVPLHHPIVSADSATRVADTRGRRTWVGAPRLGSPHVKIVV